VFGIVLLMLGALLLMLDTLLAWDATEDSAPRTLDVTEPSADDRNDAKYDRPDWLG
jgi:hypothetical protein